MKPKERGLKEKGGRKLEAQKRLTTEESTDVVVNRHQGMTKERKESGKNIPITPLKSTLRSKEFVVIKI